MQCFCGYEAPATGRELTGKVLLNKHRKECNGFWLSVRSEMHRISTALRGTPGPVSAREWDKGRSDDYPSMKVLIDWRGSWSSVLERVSSDSGQSVPVATASTLPTLDEFIAEVERISLEAYGAGLIVGYGAYDNQRTQGWPLARTMLKALGYADDKDGWRQLIADYVGRPVANSVIAQRIAFDRREQKQIEEDDVVCLPREQVLTLPSGLLICEATYQRTGRMILR